ncbi:MAG TPA: cation:dicarboxylase symporter family transporter [Thiotrichales bacterium]|nr:cation:dicarboxylase symporter family transporter [Thiotrichales bacterium]
MRIGRLSVTPFQLVILSLVGGILFGMVVGEWAGKLKWIGDAYIRLLQMTVLPYILFSLMGGLGRLDLDMARRIGIAGAGLILFLWTTAMLTLLTMPLAYPDWTSASFFSTSLITPPSSFDPLTLYIPSNPFHALANTIVPAAVVFSIAMGLALISVDNKDGLLLGLQNLSDALMKIASFVAKLAPLGIFALSAAAAGTLDLQSLARLQVYLWVYAAAWGVLTFFVLPMLVAWATPFGYREVMRDARTAMVTAFAAGTVLVVIPMIIERTKALLKEKGLESDEAGTAIDVLVPTAYTFPSVGTLLGIGFILFAGWFVGSPLDVSQYPGFIVTGAISAFGTMAVALPFMLDYFHLPSDLFQLYLIGSVMTARFATVLAAMHAVVISLLGASAMLGRLRREGMLRVLVVGLAVTALLMWGLGFALTRLVPYKYTGYEQLVTMQPMVHIQNERHIDNPQELLPLPVDRPRLEAIIARGTLRVAYPRDAVPFAFRNRDGRVVGLDLDLLRVLARKLGVGLEITRLDKESAVRALQDGRIDLLVGGLTITTQRAIHWDMSEPYITEHVGFVVPDYARKAFTTVESIRSRDDLRIAVLEVLHDSFYAPLIREQFPHATIVRIKSPREFLMGKTDADVMIYSAESGSVWTLIYPEFSVVVPQGLKTRIPIGMVLPPDEHFADFINLWLKVEKTQGIIDALMDYWVFGKPQNENAP